LRISTAPAPSRKPSNEVCGPADSIHVSAPPFAEPHRPRATLVHRGRTRGPIVFHAAAALLLDPKYFVNGCPSPDFFTVARELRSVDYMAIRHPSKTPQR
jgi:hypothetical protein